MVCYWYKGCLELVTIKKARVKKITLAEKIYIAKKDVEDADVLLGLYTYDNGDEFLSTITEDDYTYIYKENDEFYFMNLKSFSQINLNKSILGSKENFLSENLEVKINFYEDLPISITLPNQISCEVTQTEMAIKGQTVSGSYKPAILDNNLKVQVPQFINVGDKIIIDTKSIEYVKKI